MLAFDLKGAWLCKKKKLIVGEVVVSVDEAKRNCAVYHSTLGQELALYLIHGILHLSGFDDHRPRDIKRMRNREAVVMASVSRLVKGVVIKG